MFRSLRALIEGFLIIWTAATVPHAEAAVRPLCFQDIRVRVYLARMSCASTRLGVGINVIPIFAGRRLVLIVIGGNIGHDGKLLDYCEIALKSILSSSHGDQPPFAPL